MKNPYSESSSAADRAFLDILLGMAIILASLLIIVIPFINDPGRKEEAGQKPPGGITIYVDWPVEDIVDVDLWVMGPKETQPVGYSHKSGVNLNLLRDDLGHISDISGKNFEHMVGHGFIPGEYIVNIHWFGGWTPGAGGPGEDGGRHETGRAPTKPEIPVNILVSVAVPRQPSTTAGIVSSVNKITTRDILAATVTLKRSAEMNVFIFTVDKDGKLIEDSVYRDPNKRIKGRRGMAP